ncbi:hypothetical protein ACF0H5_007084 [Mactra antiquata]
MSSERFCILLTKCCGKKKEKKLLKSSTMKVDVLPGTLLLLLDVVKNSSSSMLYILETIDLDDIEVQCSHSDFKDISREQFNLLINVPTCADRFTIFQNTEWLTEGIELKEGDYVDVYDKHLTKDLIGKLRYKGPVPGIEGIHFGVHYVYDEGSGTSDGSFRNKQYFRCPPESAVFVGLHKIRKHKGQFPVPQKPYAGATAGNHYTYDQSEKGLKTGDRVVWMSDNGPEAGVVKWIGILPDSQHDDITVGVEFDNPVGSGTGKYRDQRLFTAKQNHASLVPIMGLLKEEVFPKPQKQIPDSDMLAMLTEAEGSGKTQAQVIEEQRRIMAEAQQNIPTRSPAEGSKQDFYVEKKKSSNEITDHAVVHLAPTCSKNIVPPPPAPCKGTTPSEHKTESKGVNPLYEYLRPKQEYLPEGLNEVLLGSQSSQGSKHARQKSSSEPDPDLMVGSLVEVMKNKPLYGVIKWIGDLPDQPKKLVAGLEMEEEIPAGSDGIFGNYRLFTCPPRKGLFVPLNKCRKDKRFVDDRRQNSSDRSIYFGSTETPDLPGTVSPPTSLDSIKIICGKSRGIQGHHNSCYMDATLFAMFYFTTVFDSILHRPKGKSDIPEYTSVQQVLKEGIVNPLRKNYYVRADKIMTLRKLLHEVGKIPGMMSEEKDPEEFLNLLLSEVTKADPFLKICSENSGDTQQTYFYQLIMEKDERLVLPTTQQLFELSFLQLGIKLKEVPSCLIIQMPRFGKDYKMYKRIVPSLELDITDVLENAPRECIICGDLAMFECKQCYQVHGAGLNTIAFCEGCKKMSHQHKQRVGHQCRQIAVPQRYRDLYTSQKMSSDQPIPIPREKMQLFAVICIQTSHYVSFVRTGKGREAKWIFFDSMADRMGEQSGYNIPEVQECSEIPHWLSDEYHNEIMKFTDDKSLPEHMRRLIGDAYICMYQSPDVMMFK